MPFWLSYVTDWSNMSACASVEPRLRSMREAHWDASSKSLNSRPKKTLHATERDTERVQLLRVQYWQEIGEVSLENLVFVDETGSNLAMTRRTAPVPFKAAELITMPPTSAART